MPAPVLLRTPFGGTCDATGNLTIKSIRPSANFYAIFTVALRATAGIPQWTLDLTGAPLASATGRQVTLGPYVTQPEEFLMLTVTGAGPNAVITGQLNGFFVATPEELPALLPIGGSLTIQAPAPVPWSDSGSIGINQTVTKSYGVPTGAAVVLITVSAGGAAGGTVVITGDQTGTTYANLAPSSQTLTSFQGLQGDASVTVVATTGLGGTAGVSWQLQFGQETDLLDRATRQVGQTAGLPAALPLATYGVATLSTSKAFTSGQELILLALYHPASVAELWKVRKIRVTIESITVASAVKVLLRRLNGSTPPSGGTVLTPQSFSSGNAALNASDVFQAYPAAGTVDAGVAAGYSWSLGISTASTDPSKNTILDIYIWPPAPDAQALLVRSANAEGWALSLIPVNAATIVASASAEFTVG